MKGDISLRMRRPLIMLCMKKATKWVSQQKDEVVAYLGSFSSAGHGKADAAA
jgi:hypothetical protein